MHLRQRADPHCLSGLLRGDFGVGQYRFTGGDHIPFRTQPAQILPHTALTIEQVSTGFETRHKGSSNVGVLVVK